MRIKAFAALMLSAFLCDPASACFGPMSEEYVVLPNIPKDVPQDAVVLRVEVTGSAEQRLEGYRKGSKIRVLGVVRGEFPDKYVRLVPELFTSCGRWEAGALSAQAYVVGKVKKDGRGSEVFVPYQFRLTQ